MELMRISNFFLEELKKYINFRQNSDTCLQNLKKKTQSRHNSNIFLE